MELRPLVRGNEYHGPVRVPVSRPAGSDTFSGVIYRPRRRFHHLRTADQEEERVKHLQQMAEERRAERKAEQERIRIFGPDISSLDENGGPIGVDCKVLKTLDFDGGVRLYYRRQDCFIETFYFSSF